MNRGINCCFYALSVSKRQLHRYRYDEQPAGTSRDGRWDGGTVLLCVQTGWTQA